MSTILITGAASGLGYAIHRELLEAGHSIIPYDHANGYDVRKPVVGDIKQLDVLINCAGVNLINMLEDVTEADWDAVMDTNAKGIFMMTKACLPLLKASKGTVLNVVSNASHLAMTSSLAYNCSKAAALMATKQLARELTKRWGITVFSVSPNKLKGTAMSNAIDEQVVRTRGWTKEYAQQYQLNGLLTGEETPPRAVAEFIAFLLSSKERHKYLSGCDLQYGL